MMRLCIKGFYPADGRVYYIKISFWGHNMV